MKKKLMAAGLAAAVLGASLTGCQSKPAETTAAETTAAETTKAETEASSEAEPMQKRMIRLWRILTLFWTGIPMRFTPSCM